jgi:hypothetical protein
MSGISNRKFFCLGLYLVSREQGVDAFTATVKSYIFLKLYINLGSYRKRNVLYAFAAPRIFDQWQIE